MKSLIPKPKNITLRRLNPKITSPSALLVAFADFKRRFLIKVVLKSPHRGRIQLLMRRSDHWIPRKRVLNKVVHIIVIKWPHVSQNIFWASINRFRPAALRAPFHVRHLCAPNYDQRRTPVLV
jgi:hypothetical protein